MSIIIRIPTREEILSSGVVVSVATFPVSWSKCQLNDYANRSGVYIHHSIQVILYIGKTTNGTWATFGERLRREFQTKASQNSNLFRLLSNLNQEVKCVMFDLDELDAMIETGDYFLERERKALIMEQVFVLGKFVFNLKISHGYSSNSPRIRTLLLTFYITNATNDTNKKKTTLRLEKIPNTLV